LLLLNIVIPFTLTTILNCYGHFVVVYRLFNLLFDVIRFDDVVFDSLLIPIYCFVDLMTLFVTFLFGI